MLGAQHGSRSMCGSSENAARDSMALVSLVTLIQAVAKSAADTETKANICFICCSSGLSFTDQSASILIKAEISFDVQTCFGGWNAEGLRRCD